MKRGHGLARKQGSFCRLSTEQEGLHKDMDRHQCHSGPFTSCVGLGWRVRAARSAQGMNAGQEMTAFQVVL